MIPDEQKPAAADDAPREISLRRAVVGGVALGLALLFLPLALALFEHALTETTYVEDLCRALGIYEPLSRVYAPVLWWLERRLVA